MSTKAIAHEEEKAHVFVRSPHTLLIRMGAPIATMEDTVLVAQKGKVMELERWLSRGPGLKSQHLHGGLRLSVTLLPGDLMPSPGFHRHCTLVHRHASRQNKHTHSHARFKKDKTSGC